MDQDGRNNQKDFREWLDRASDAFSASTSWFDLNIRAEVERNIRQFQGKHPKGSKYLSDSYRNRSKLFRPKTRACVRKSEAICAGAYFASEDVTAIRPVDDNNNLNKLAADFYKALLQIRLTRPHPHGIPWFLTLVGGHQDAQTTGVVVSKQEWEYDPIKGIDRPRVVLKPVENVRIDPGADWADPVNTSPYIIDMVPMYVGTIKRMMSDDTPEDKRWFSLSEAEIRSAVQKSADTTRLTREDRSDSKENVNSVTDYNIGWVHHNLIEVDGKDYVYLTLGTEYMLTEPIPLETVYLHGIRPYVMGCVIVETHKVYPSAKVALLREPQKEINDIVNERRDNVKRILDPRWKALRGKQVDLRSLTRNVPASVTLLNSLSDAEEISTPNATGASFAEQDRVNGDFDELAGNFSQSSIQNNRRLNETVGGLNLLSSDADLVGEYETRVFNETWVEPVLRHIVLLEKYHETDRTILETAGRAVGIEPEELTDEVVETLLNEEVLLNVNVGIGSTNPQKQLDRFVGVTKAAIELLGESAVRLKPEEVIKELYGKAGYKDGSRFFDLTEEKPDPLQDLQRLIAEAKLELTQAQTKKTLEDADQSKATKVVKMVEALYSAMQTAQTAVSVPGVAPAADAIAKSAGYVDQDQSPIYPAGTDSQARTGVPAIRENTSPMFPAQPIGPGEGMMHGIETQENDGVQG